MIEELRISSLGVIDSSTLELGPGLTVSTGETGAGKTMLVAALGIVAGGRAERTLVREGSAAPMPSSMDRASSERSAVVEIGAKV